MAELFHGFRIDNCHSTPMHVAEHMMAVARRVRPNLVVVAELFTGSIRTDLDYVERLGLTAVCHAALRCARVPAFRHLSRGLCTRANTSFS